MFIAHNDLAIQVLKFNFNSIPCLVMEVMDIKLINNNIIIINNTKLIKIDVALNCMKHDPLGMCNMFYTLNISYVFTEFVLIKGSGVYLVYKF